MDYKRLFETSLLLLRHPARAWWIVLHKGERSAMLGEFLYPLIMLCGTSLFVGRILSNGFGWDSVYTGLISAAVRSFSLLFAYYASAYATAFLSAKFTDRETPREVTDMLAGYSMVVLLLLEICLGLFPEVLVLAFIAQLYTLKVVWDGAAVLMRIDEEHRLGYTMALTIVILMMPVIINKLMGYLSVLLG